MKDAVIIALLLALIGSCVVRDAGRMADCHKSTCPEGTSPVFLNRGNICMCVVKPAGYDK
jgi:hypothetical protein